MRLRGRSYSTPGFRLFGLFAGSFGLFAALECSVLFGPVARRASEVMLILMPGEVLKFFLVDGELLRDYREQCEYGVRELGRMAEVAASTISELERGTRRLAGRRTLARLAEALRLPSWKYLLKNPTPDPAPDDDDKGVHIWDSAAGTRVTVRGELAAKIRELLRERGPRAIIDGISLTFLGVIDNLFGDPVGPTEASDVAVSDPGEKGDESVHSGLLRSLEFAIDQLENEERSVILRRSFGLEDRGGCSEHPPSA